MVEAALLLEKQKRIPRAISSYLRIFYHPRTSIEKKQNLIIKVAEFYLSINKMREAKALMKKIDIGLLEKVPKLNSKYIYLRKKISG